MVCCDGAETWEAESRKWEGCHFSVVEDVGDNAAVGGEALVEVNSPGVLPLF